MANIFIRFSVDESLKNKASMICKRIGIDLQTYLRLCLVRLVSNKKIPFEMALDDKKSDGIEALLKMNKISENYSNSNMTLEEINAEINEVRK